LSPRGIGKAGGRRSHTARSRLKPGIFQYDYLSLSALVADVETLIRQTAPLAGSGAPIALDVGCGTSPYRRLVEDRGFVLKTIDIDAETSPNYIGSIEETGLPDACVSLVICTQVLEHLIDPGRGLKEIFRILVPGGHLIASAPHVWFYHPHPSDNWRFTQEGLVRLVVAAGFEPQKLLSQGGGSVLSYFQIVNFLLFGAIGRFGAGIYALNNMAARLGDRLIRNDLFCINFALLARKPGRV
jgi:SAM-dependent methyltransferase